MNDQKYYFNRDAESLAIGEIIDNLGRRDKEVFCRLHVDGEDYEAVGQDLKIHPETVEEIEERIFEKLKPLVTLVMNKEFEADDILNDIERDFVIDTFRNEIHFREDRANFMKTRRLSHVPA